MTYTAGLLASVYAHIAVMHAQTHAHILVVAAFCCWHGSIIVLVIIESCGQ